MHDIRTAFWRSLHTPGHDTASVWRAPGGWLLAGTAVFLGKEGPVAVDYRVEAGSDWTVQRGTLAGTAAGRRFRHEMERTPDGWVLDGRAQGLAGLVDLDFGFTPATNLQQLSRVSLGIGERAAFSVVWFDLGEAGLTELPQVYERLGERFYRYVSPPSGYEATLEMDETGFVQTYPGLWEMDAPNSLSASSWE